MTPELQKTLPEHPDPLDKLSARINSFTAAIADKMWLKDDMGYINSGFQYALGKKVINTGSQNMITLTTGHLYDLADYKPLSGNAREIADLRDTAEGRPFLFVYEHPTLYDPAMMPAGYEALDHSAQMADEVLAALREGGVEVLDSRDVLPASGHPLDELLMVTDQHWSTLAAITMAQAIAGELNDMTGAALDPTLLDPENLNTLVHEKLFMGKYGQRVGPGIVDPDDIVEYWPKADTHIPADTKRGSPPRTTPTALPRGRDPLRPPGARPRQDLEHPGLHLLRPGGGLQPLRKPRRPGLHHTAPEGLLQRPHRHLHVPDGLRRGVRGPAPERGAPGTVGGAVPPRRRGDGLQPANAAGRRIRIRANAQLQCIQFRVYGQVAFRVEHIGGALGGIPRKRIDRRPHPSI